MATLVELYLDDRGGSSFEFLMNLENGQRLGQAFFNALSGTDQDHIRGTIHDPFYLDAAMAERKIHQCIEYLLDLEDKKAVHESASLEVRDGEE